MPLVPWDDSYSVHLIEVDQQHQQLFHLLNRLHEAMTGGKSKEILERILEGLVEYTRTHFATEEALMMTYRYPDFRMHKQQHDEFIAQVANFQQQYKAGKLGLSIQVRDFLKDWLVGHIRGYDVKMAPFVRSKGAR